jgi:hypothetical protein
MTRLNLRQRDSSAGDREDRGRMRSCTTCDSSDFYLDPTCPGSVFKNWSALSLNRISP